MENEPKLCKNCKYITTEKYDSDRRFCTNSVVTNVDLVTGWRSYPACSVARGTSGACSPEGKLFKQKPIVESKVETNPWYKF